MTSRRSPGRPRPPARPPLVLAALVVLLGAGLAPGRSSAPAAADAAGSATLDGMVRAADAPLAGATVTLLATGPDGAGPRALATATTGPDGAFSLDHAVPVDPLAVLYLRARSADSAEVVLASVLGTAPVPRDVVVTEQTTVATAYALAQFTEDGLIAGTAPALQNAAGMAHNLADVTTGGVGQVLDTSPNGAETSTLSDVGSLSNMISACVASAPDCAELRSLTTPAGDAAPADTFDAMGDLARHPGASREQVRRLFELSQRGPVPAQPSRDRAPDAWTLALRFDGDGHSLSGPGNFAIDHEGNIWTLNNYDYDPDPDHPVCGSGLLMEFDPTGRYVAGSPYSGGGLSGAGFGIDIDPFGQVWVGNYGFAAPAPGCPADQQPTHDSVSVFTLDGEPLSPDAGYTQGGVDWPQGTVSDERGNIWIANCNSTTVTRYPDGDPSRAQEITDLGLTEPFAIAHNRAGDAFVTGIGSDNVARIAPDGTPYADSPISGPFSRPMGITADSKGNMWVANSGLVDLPCPVRGSGDGFGGSAALLSPEGEVLSPTPFTGGGMTVPWGIVVDGDDNVWVGNFAGKRVAQLCGTDPSTCPPGTDSGDPISPDITGYGFDGLTRTTGLAVDQSGNVWVTNNWKEDPVQTNPGGYQIVAFVGLAAPIDVPAPRDKPVPTPAPTPVPSPAALPVPADARFTG